MKNRLKYLAVPVLCAVPLSLAACGDSDSSDQTSGETPAAASTTDAAESPDTGQAADCAAPAFPVIELDTGANEPVFGVPVPEDWERDTSLDSDMVRLAVTKVGETPTDVATAVVAVEPSPVSGQDELDRQLPQLEQFAEDGSVDVHESTTCGYPSFRIDYTGAMGNASIESSVLMVSVPATDGNGYITASMSVQSTDSGNADYQATRDAMFDGFQVSGAGTGDSAA